MLAVRDTVTAPYIVESTGRFDGDDGQWSTFGISIGSPPQSVRVLPGTSNTEIAVPFEEGCEGQLWAQVPNCGDLRGIDNTTRNGFIRGDSQTWDYGGIYYLMTEQDVITAPGMYGTDTVKIGRSGDTAHNASLADQAVAGISQTSFFLGSLGLSSAATNISGTFTPSLLASMKNQSIIPSMSYGYTAGQSYNNQRVGSLILGGYDKALLSSSVVQFPVDNSSIIHPRLAMDVQSIVSHNSAGGATQGYLASAITVSIDTSITHMWLPSAACDIFASTFGLQEDLTTGYFLLNDTAHTALKSANPQITFVIGGERAGGRTNIVMNYNSLDLAVGIPIYNTSKPYFPIRRAANDSQLIFGRAFLQEAYLVVDWERNNFTIGPVLSSTSPSVVAITPPSKAATSNGGASGTPSGSSTPDPTPTGLSGGAIAGIVIPIIIIIAAAIGLFFFLRKRRERQRLAQVRQSYETQPPEYDPAGGTFYDGKHESMSTAKSPGPEIAEMYDSSKPRAELTADNVRRLEEMAELSEQRELMSTPILELEGDRADSELDAASAKGDNRNSGVDRTSGLERPPLHDRLSSGSVVVSPLRNSTTTSPGLIERVRSPLSAHSDVYEME